MTHGIVVKVFRKLKTRTCFKFPLCPVHPEDVRVFPTWRTDCFYSEFCSNSALRVQPASLQPADHPAVSKSPRPLCMSRSITPKTHPEDGGKEASADFIQELSFMKSSTWSCNDVQVHKY